MSANARGALLALLAFALFSSHDVIVKVLGGGYSPIQIVFFSVLLSFPLAMLMMIRDAQPGTLLPVHPWWITLRTAAAVVTAVAVFFAFTALPLTQVYAIIFATPLLITILAVPVLGERVRLRRWLAVLVGLLGVLVVLRPGQTDLGVGHLAALLAAVGGALASIVVRKIGQEERPVVMLLYPMMANFVLMGLALPFVYQPMPLTDFGLVAVMALLAWIGARLIIVAYLTGEAAIIAPMQYSQIIWASLLGALFFDEGIDRATALGAGIIIASGLYIVLRESRGGSETTPVLRTRSRLETPGAPRVSAQMRLSGQEPPRSE